MGNVVSIGRTGAAALPTIEKQNVGRSNKPAAPGRPLNSAMRSREYLTAEEVSKLAAATSAGRYGHRDSTLILIAYRHGLRVSELVALRWDQVDLKAGLLHVSTLKKGTPSTHPLRGPELRALERLQREPTNSLAYVFTTESGGPMTASNVQKMLGKAGERAGIGFKVHPHEGPPTPRVPIPNPCALSAVGRLMPQPAPILVANVR